MIQILITLILLYVVFAIVRGEYNARNEIKRQKKRLEEIDRLQRRIDKAFEMDTEIIKMFFEGDIANANELAKVSFEERMEIEKEIRRMGL